MKEKRNQFLVNVIDDRYGRLLVVEEIEEVRPRKVIAVCDCGAKKEYYLHNLRSGMTQSCGCLQKERVGKRLIDLTGQRFGKLTVIKRVENAKDSNIPRWLCRCDCGKETVVYANSLREKMTRSCGCKQGGGPQVYWTKDVEKEIIRLKNEGKDLEEISELVDRSPSALMKRFTEIRKSKGEKTCAAPDCRKKFIPLAPTAKYCSDRCRYRASKQKTYAKRKDKGLCPQCGDEKDETTATYCSKCQEYFKDRYHKNKK